MLAKVAGDSRFKVGEGDKTWNELDFVQPDSIQLGGGLATDAQGKIYVDFSQMPTDKFEKLVQSIRVPIWLSANTNFYVDGATGSDVLDTGRGLSINKPFKTIQACVNYVCDNYNLSRYNVTILIAAGTYNESLVLGKYTTNTGKIYIRTQSNKQDVIIETYNTATAVRIYDGYSFYFLKFKSTWDVVVTAWKWHNLIYCSNTLNTISFIGCIFEFNCGASTNVAMTTIFFLLNCQQVSFEGTSSLATYIISNIATPSSIFYLSNSTFTCNGAYSDAEITDIYIEGRCQVFLRTDNSIFRLTGLKNLFKFIIPEGKTFTGKKYQLENYSRVNVNGAGANFFPGTTAGTMDESCRYM